MSIFGGSPFNNANRGGAATSFSSIGSSTGGGSTFSSIGGSSPFSSMGPPSGSTGFKSTTGGSGFSSMFNTGGASASPFSAASSTQTSSVFGGAAGSSPFGGGGGSGSLKDPHKNSSTKEIFHSASMKPAAQGRSPEELRIEAYTGQKAPASGMASASPFSAGGMSGGSMFSGGASTGGSPFANSTGSFMGGGGSTFSTKSSPFSTTSGGVMGAGGAGGGMAGGMAGGGMAGGFGKSTGGFSAGGAPGGFNSSLNKTGGGTGMFSTANAGASAFAQKPNQLSAGGGGMSGGFNSMFNKGGATAASGFGGGTTGGSAFATPGKTGSSFGTGGSQFASGGGAGGMFGKTAGASGAGNPFAPKSTTLQSGGTGGFSSTLGGGSGAFSAGGSTGGFPSITAGGGSGAFSKPGSAAALGLSFGKTGGSSGAFSSGGSTGGFSSTLKAGGTGGSSLFSGMQSSGGGSSLFAKSGSQSLWGNQSSTLGNMAQPTVATPTSQPYGHMNLPMLRPQEAGESRVRPPRPVRKKAVPQRLQHYKLAPRSAAKIHPRGPRSSGLFDGFAESPQMFRSRMKLDLVEDAKPFEHPILGVAGESSATEAAPRNVAIDLRIEETPAGKSSVPSRRMPPPSDTFMTPKPTDSGAGICGPSPLARPSFTPAATGGKTSPDKTAVPACPVEATLNPPKKPIACRPPIVPEGYEISPSSAVAVDGARVDWSCVEDFVVMRPGVAQVTFHGLTDVRNLDLTNIVRFERKKAGRAIMVEVYPEDVFQAGRNKPRVGEELNKPATVKFFDCPRVKKKNKLKGSYDEKNRTFTFQVEHFSIYDLDDSDFESDAEELELEEEEEDSREDDGDADELKSDKHIVADGDIYSEEESSLAESAIADAFSREEMKTYTIIKEEPFDFGQAPLLPAQLGLEPRKIQLMKSALFLSDDLHQESGGDRSPPLAKPAKRRARRDVQWAASEAALSPECFNQRRQLQAASSILTFGEDSLTHNKTKSATDHGLFMGRSFRVGWSPDGRLAIAGIPSSIGSTKRVKRQAVGLIHIDKVKVTPLSAKNPETQSRYVGLLQQHHLASDKLEDLSGAARPSAPRWKLEKPFDNVRGTIAQLENMHDSFVGAAPRHGTMGLAGEARATDSSFLFQDDSANFDLDAVRQGSLERAFELEKQSLFHFLVVWGLIDALFGAETGASQFDDDTPRGNDARPYAEYLGRRTALSAWLQQAVKGASDIDMVAADHAKNALGKVFAALSGRQIAAAVGVASARTEYHTPELRLALMISQACNSSAQIRSDMKNQLEVWSDSWKADPYEFMENRRYDVFRLLAGEMFCVAGGLDWKRCLGLGLWYHADGAVPIPQVLDTYDRGVEEESFFPPLPPYLEESRKLKKWSSKEPVPFRDTLYHLLHLFVAPETYPFRHALLPQSHTPFKLDYQLSWHLATVVEALPTARRVPDTPHMASISVYFASQLDSVGLWDWAIYVLLHLPPTPARDRAVKHVLAQNCVLDYLPSPSTEGAKGGATDGEAVWQEALAKERFVQEELGVPAEWVQEAKAYVARYVGDQEAELYHLLGSGNWNLAHQVLLDTIGPRRLMLGEYDRLRSEVLVPLQNNSGLVRRWTLGGQIFLDYINLVLSSPSAATERSQRSIGESICARIGELWGAERDGQRFTKEQRVCYSRMSSDVVHFLSKSVALEHGADQNTLAMTLAPHLRSLALPDDDRLLQLNSMTSSLLSMLQS